MKDYLLNSVKNIKTIKKIRGEASTRSFFRFTDDGYISKIAMVYPEKNKEEIERILKLTKIYKKYKIDIPEIYNTLNDRIIIIQDLGNLSFQTHFNKSKTYCRKKLIDNIVMILSKLRKIPLEKAAFILDKTRLKAEMDFFLKYYIVENISKEKKRKLRKALHSLVDSLSNEKIFAHRDFHSRNMQILNDKIYLIDYQDSLQASPYYDMVSFINDSYLDLKSLREYFLSNIVKSGLNINIEQMNLTALQRNIKALGTFGYQINVRKNLSYKKYIKRTLSYIQNNSEYNSFNNSIPLLYL